METKNEDQAAAPAAADEVSATEISELREEALADDPTPEAEARAAGVAPEEDEKITDPPVRYATEVETAAMKLKYGSFYERAVQLFAEGLSEPQVDQRIQEELHEAISRDEDQHHTRMITLGETVFYGDGTGQVWPAIVTHVYGKEARTAMAGRNANVDLQVFKRKFVCDVENVSMHDLDTEGNLDGWTFRR